MPIDRLAVGVENENGARAGMPADGARPNGSRFMSKSKPDTGRFDDRLSAVYDPKGDKVKLYDDWAGTYDHDLLDDLGYVAHLDAGAIFLEQVPDRSTSVLDVACGTGLVGRLLRQHGYDRIDGVDFSAGMLESVEKQKIYRRTWQHDFTRPAGISEPYQALVCVGLFSYNLPKISDMHNVVDCVEPGGLCVITVNGAAWAELDLEPDLYREAAAHDFTIIEIREAEYIRNENIDARVLVIQRGHG